MQSKIPDFESAREKWWCRGLALLLILGVTGFRLVYLASFCTLDLAPDEAHYWDWSRHLDWSYYSKGPLVALLIRAGEEVAGHWCRNVLGNEMLAVRLPAVLCGSLLLVSLYLLTAQIYRREKWALLVVLLGLSLPMVSAGSLLITIDSPYTCLWGWGLVMAWAAIQNQKKWAWCLAGVVVGLGILAKYTMVLFLPSVGLFLLTSPRHRGQLRRPGFWVMAAVAGLCCLPILIWNQHNGWVSYRHVQNLAGMSQEREITWLGPLTYLGTQFGLLLGFWFVYWVLAMWRHRPWGEPAEGLRYLWWLSAPMFLVFFAFSPSTNGGQPNWPVTAYISGLVLMAGWLILEIQSRQGWSRRLWLGCVSGAFALGILVTAVMIFSEWARPVLLWACGPATKEQPMPLRRLDPTCRLRGWRELGQEVDRIRQQLQAEGRQVVLAGTGWSLPGEVGFYCQGHPAVYSLGPWLGDRRSQYDFWEPNPVSDEHSFRGQTFLVVGFGGADLTSLFDRVEPPHIVIHEEDGVPVAGWAILVGHGFRGNPYAQADRPQVKRGF